MTFRQFDGRLEAIPTATAWYLADLGEARGKQKLFTRQSPQRLKALREHALIESAVSSNRIEGVVVDRSRIGTVVFGKSRLRHRDEEEVRGYPSPRLTTRRGRPWGEDATVPERSLRPPRSMPPSLSNASSRRSEQARGSSTVASGAGSLVRRRRAASESTAARAVSRRGRFRSPISPGLLSRWRTFDAGEVFSTKRA